MKKKKSESSKNQKKKKHKDMKENSIFGKRHEGKSSNKPNRKCS